MRRISSSLVAIVAVVVLVALFAGQAQAGTWKAVKGGDNIHYHAVDLVDATHIWAGGVTFIPAGSMGFEDTAIIGRSTDGGATWKYASSHQAGDTATGWNFLTATTLDFVDANHGWAALSDGTIVATTDGGATWSLQAEGSFEMRDNNWGYSSLAMADATQGVAVGSWVGFIGVSKPRIVYTVNGKDWLEAAVPDLSNVSLEGVCVSGGIFGWAVGSIGATEKSPLILMTHDGGVTWVRQVAALTGPALHDVAFVNSERGWAVGDEGTILVTVDGGSTWWSQATPTSESLLAVTFADAATGWAVGEKGTILETTNGGLSWVAQTTGVETTLRDVAVAGGAGVVGGTVWVAGDEGTLLTSAIPSGGTPSGAFIDISGSPYSIAIESLASAGVVVGFPDGTFRPDATVRRGQFAKMLLGALGIVPGDSIATRFTDLGAADANGYPHRWVQAAYDQGITNGTNAAQTLFAPWNTIRRDQAVSMIVRAAEKLLPGVLETPPAGWTSPLFAGVDPPHGQNLRIAEYNGLLTNLTGMGAGWNPAAPATRGEVAQMLYELRLAELSD